MLGRCARPVLGRGLSVRTRRPPSDAGPSQPTLMSHSVSFVGTPPTIWKITSILEKSLTSDFRLHRIVTFCCITCFGKIVLRIFDLRH